MTDERVENSQKDEVETLFIWYIFHSNRTKLFFYRHLSSVSLEISNFFGSKPRMLEEW